MTGETNRAYRLFGNETRALARLSDDFGHEQPASARVWPMTRLGIATLTGILKQRIAAKMDDNHAALVPKLHGSLPQFSRGGKCR